jgi:SRSO17 transposase
VSLVCWGLFCLTRDMDERELAGLRTALLEYADEVFAGFARADQRANGVRYLRGLMLDGRRKSMQPMGERLGVDHQQLQQFMTSSTWDYVAVRRRLAAKVLDVVDPVAWVIDDTGFVKDGTASPGVARQYSGTLGKVGNCQVAVSLHAVTDSASGVLDWRLFLPESWDENCLPAAGEGPQHEDERARREQKAAVIRDRRSRAKIPDSERNRPKWQQALEMIDELASWGHVPPLVVADAGYGQVGAFRQGLSERAISYVLATTAAISAHRAQATPVRPVASGKGRPPKDTPTYPDRAPTLKELALQAGPDTAQRITWRTGTRTSPDNHTAQMSGHFFTLRVRPAGRGTPSDEHGVLPERWLLIEWPPDKGEPTDYWLSDLPIETPIATLVWLAKIRWRIEHDYRELKTGLGLDHFEGRTFTGWHRHATLVTAAQLFLTTLRKRTPKADGQA